MAPPAFVTVHRAERSFPVLPEPAVLATAVPPELADTEQQGRWAQLLPLLGSASAVALAARSRSRGRFHK